MQVKVDCFVFRIREKGVSAKSGKAKYLNVDTIAMERDGSEFSLTFTHFFSAFVNQFGGKFIRPVGDDIAIYISGTDWSFGSQSRIISGYAKGGRSGIERDVQDVNKADDEPILVLSPDHVVNQRFLFAFYIPENTNFGLLIIQGYSTNSITSSFVRLFRGFVSRNAKNRIIEIDRYTPKKLVDKYFDSASVKKVTFTKYRYSADRSNSIFNTKLREETSMKIIIFNLGRIGEAILEGLKGQFNVGLGTASNEFVMFSEPYLETIGMEESSISIQLDLNGRSTTLKGSKDFKIQPSYYFDEDDFAPNRKTGLFDETEVKKACIELFNLIIEEVAAKKSGI